VKHPDFIKEVCEALTQTTSKETYDVCENDDLLVPWKDKKKELETFLKRKGKNHKAKRR